MGLFDRFRKEERIHFVRNEAGEVVDVEREYKGRGSKTPVSDRLLAEAKAEKKRDRQRWKQEQKEAYERAFRKARLERMSRVGRQAGMVTLADRFTNYSIDNNFNPFGSMFDKGMKYPKRSKGPKKSKTKYKVIGGKAYPVAGTSKKKKKKKRSSGGGFGGYDVFDNWGYMK